MCKSTDSKDSKDSSTATEDNILKEESAAAIVDPEGTTTTTTTTEVQYLPWWRGGGLIPRNGTDLGVWERSLEDRSNCITRWSLSFLNPLLLLGSLKVLDANDVGIPSQQDVAEHAFQSAKAVWLSQVDKANQRNAVLRAAYDKALAKCTTATDSAAVTVTPTATHERRPTIPEPKWNEPSMASTLAASFGRFRIFLALFYYVLSALLAFVPVLILNDLVKYFQHYEQFGPNVPYQQGMAPPWVEVAGLGVIPVVVSMLQTRQSAIMAHCGVFVRTAVSTLLYQKCLRVSAAGRAKTSTGQVVNMMSNDTMQLLRFLQFLGMTVVAPIQIVVALYLIFQQVRIQMEMDGRMEVWMDGCRIGSRTIYTYLFLTSLLYSLTHSPSIFLSISICVSIFP